MLVFCFEGVLLHAGVLLLVLRWCWWCAGAAGGAGAAAAAAAAAARVEKMIVGLWRCSRDSRET